MSFHLLQILHNNIAILCYWSLGNIENTLKNNIETYSTVGMYFSITCLRCMCSQHPKFTPHVKNIWVVVSTSLWHKGHRIEHCTHLDFSFALVGMHSLHNLPSRFLTISGTFTFQMELQSPWAFRYTSSIYCCMLHLYVLLTE